MKKLRFLVSLITPNNDYQQAQAAAAGEAARRLDVDVEITFAENDVITQSTQLLRAIQSASGPRPDAILINPVRGPGLPQVAHAAADAGIGWVVLNRKAEYVSELCRSCSAPMFIVSPDQVEIGRIQGRQFGALLQNGGSVLYIQGPSDNSTVMDRMAGMQQTKPANVEVTALKGQWTEESGERAVTAWLQFATSRRAQFDLVGSQNDMMAMGARKAFEGQSRAQRERWLSLPYTGVDGLPQTGQAWVRIGKLTATIVVPPTISLALEMLTQAMRTGTKPCELTLVDSTSFPPIEALAAIAGERFPPRSA